MGNDKEDLLLTFKSLGGSVIDYAAPIFSPSLKQTHVKKLQTMQNHCLCVITGSHLAASTEHLHHETMTLPVDDHLQLISRQFLATALQRSHPSFEVVSAQPGPRPLRHTLTSRHSQAVAPFLRGGAIPDGGRADALKDLHTSAVAVAVNNMDSNPNRVILARPPAIHSSEAKLPRHWRSALSQLRSGFCRCLNSYRAVLDPTTSTLCPDCNADNHSVRHLFECATFPTTLLEVDLWSNPLHVARFLSLLPSFSHLPPVPPF